MHNIPDTLAEKLKTNKTFCMFPWTHMFIDPNGDVFPCCIGGADGSFGNVQHHTLEQIWNNDKFKNLRLKMLAGEESKCCFECYRLEKGAGGSLRYYANNLTGKHFPITENTQNDGELPEFKLRYLDVRFSNVCNFKCRYCGEIYSSAWAAENKKLYLNTNESIKHASNGDNSLFNQIKNHLDGLECIYFAGGEPFIMPEHYDILFLLQENKLFDIPLRYNSNCSKLKFKNHEITTIWKNFNRIHLAASLDSYGERAEYMRHGTVWKEIVENIDIIKQECPHVEIGFNCVVSCLNILTLSEFIQTLIDTKFITPDTHNSFYPLSGPECFRIETLPLELRIKAKEKLENFVKNNSNNLGHHLIGTIINICENFINVTRESKPEMVKLFKEEILLRDSLRNENFCETFPELKDWFNTI